MAVGRAVLSIPLLLMIVSTLNQLRCLRLTFGLVSSGLLGATLRLSALTRMLPCLAELMARTVTPIFAPAVSSYPDRGSCCRGTACRCQRPPGYINYSGKLYRGRHSIGRSFSIAALLRQGDVHMSFSDGRFAQTVLSCECLRGGCDSECYTLATRSGACFMPFPSTA